MRNTLLIFTLLWWSATALTAQAPIETPSSIAEVTVYLSGAQITREANLTLKKGDNTFLFKGLASDINPSSIQATAPSAVIINSVSHEVNYLSTQELSPRRQKISDSLQGVKDELKITNNAIQVYGTERTMLLANQKLSGEARGVNVDDLERAANYFRGRLQNISEKVFALGKTKRELEDQQRRLKRQMQELNVRKNQPSNDIELKVRAERAGKFKVALRYLVNSAGWVPAYDLRVQDAESKIKLTYRADVMQNTGIDWEDIKLTLSSANPNQNGSKPELSQWNLYAYAPGSYGRKSLESSVYGAREKSGVKSDKNTATTGAVNGAYGGYAMDQKTLADYTQVVEGATSAEFQIEIRQNIPSDGKAQQVAVQNANLPASFLHTAAPKLDPDAFLLARVTDWESLNLLPGSVNIYFDGTYIAESYIDPAYTQDTLEFSMGRDKKVVIERNQLKDFSKVRSLGANRERTFAYEFVVRNTKKTAVELVLQDQIPVSMDEDITIKVEESSGGELKKETGIMTWRLNLAPAETKKIKLIFSVKHPKKKTVPGI